MIALIRNETLKLIRRKRLYIVIGILAAIVGIVSYGQYRHMKNQPHRNWRAEIQQRLAGYNNNIRRSPADAPWARSMRAEIKRLQFYLDHDIDPNQPTSPMFVRGFANVAGFLLLPLLVAVLGSDIVSAEHAEGTDKLLLTRPIRRWKVLTSKLITLWIFTTITLIIGAMLSYLISSPFLPRGGWNAPTFTGFSTGGAAFRAEAVRQLPLWKDTLIAYGLEWYALLTVAAIALLLSVVFRSSAAAIGTMLASLIAGTILTRLTPDWTAAKFLFVSALPLADYYTGEPPPYDGMSMLFCITLLGAWAIAAILAAYALFVNRDVFG
jgi:ABC-2 type transport system permease protein